MAYDFEKYRDKREKVLGQKRKRLGAGGIALAFAALFLVVMGGILLPRAVAYLKERGLNDAIIRVEGDVQAVVDTLQTVDGVKRVAVDHSGKRLVVTYHRSLTGASALVATLQREGAHAYLLNDVDHLHRRMTLEKEAGQ